MTPYLQDADVTLFHGDALAVMRELPDESVDCCVTSPPYWGLRDYGQEGQLGLEPTLEEYVQRMVEVFREARRVLASHGTVWLNLGDSYNAYNGNRGETGSTLEGRRQHEVGRPRLPSGAGLSAGGLKQKDLVGVPWRVAFALQADGWYLRSDIIWAKPNPMPESVTDRPTKAHEYVFLLSKQPRYFFDQEAVREPYVRLWDEKNGGSLGGGTSYEEHGVGNHHKRRSYPMPNEARGPDGRRKTTVQGADGSIQHRDGERWPNGGRNIRSVWEIATQPYPEAHFATFPEELARRCIAAGCPESVCRVCGKPRERLTEASYRSVPGGSPRGANNNTKGAGGEARTNDRALKDVTTVGFTDCECEGRGWVYEEDAGKWRPGIVLDPFVGSGTTCHVARKLGRHSVGIDLSAEYLALAARRLQQQSLFALDNGAERSPSAERTQAEAEDPVQPLSRAEASD